MSAEPRNAATERLAYHVEVLHRQAALPRELYTDDFVFEDHRRLVGLPTADAEAFARSRKVNLELGAVGGRTERILGVAGESCCCIVHVTTFEGGQVSEMIQVLQYDQQVERLRRLVLFDPDDQDAALAEMERLHAGIDSPGA